MLIDIVGKALQWLKAWPHSWWFLQALGCTTIFGVNVYALKYGFDWKSYGLNILNVLLITGWTFALSYDISGPIGKASSAWFIAQAVLTFYGFLLIFVAGEPFALHKFFGLMLVSLGTYIFAFGC